MHVVNPDVAGQRRGGDRVVASEHRDVIAVATQLRDDLGGLGPQLVTHRDRSDHPAVVLDEHRRRPGLLHPVHLAGKWPGIQPSGPAKAKRCPSR